MTEAERSEFERALALLRSWVVGNGDERFVTKEQVRELLNQSGEFLTRYPV